MIWDSSPWKYDIGKIAFNLDRRSAQKRWSSSSLARVERDVMVGFYMVRKLVEAKKLSDALVAHSLTLRLHRRIGRVPDLLNWHHLDRAFELDQHTVATRSLKFVCDQVVHSYIFMVSTVDQGGLDGFFLASDRQRADGLFYLSADEAVRALLSVANDDIWQAEYVRQADGQLKIAAFGPPPE